MSKLHGKKSSWVEGASDYKDELVNPKSKDVFINRASLESAMSFSSQVVPSHTPAQKTKPPHVPSLKSKIQ